MKKTIFSILLFCLSFAAFSQQLQMIEETSNLRKGFNPTTQDSAWYEVRTTLFQDGSVAVNELYVGNDEAAINMLSNLGEERANQFAFMANQTWQKNTFTDFILQVNTLMTQQFGISLIKSTVDKYGDVVNNTTWQVKSGANTFTGTMVIHPNGNQLRLTIGATNYNVLPVGQNWLRINNFPDGSFTDLYRVMGPGLQFKNLEQTIIITKQ
jgi:hypothetical protein